MAIQVNGTEVISNSRALNNIAAIDAATAAAINAGGVGSSNPTYTTNEAISKRQTIAVLADLTASQTRKPQVTGKSTNFSPSVVIEGGRGLIKWIAEHNILAFLGNTSTSSGTACMQLLKIIDEDNYVLGSRVDFPGTYTHNYQRSHDVAIDKLGNGGYYFHAYRGTSNTHYAQLHTFSVNLSTMATSSVSSGNQWGGDDYYFQCKIAAYDDNKFIAIKPHSQNEVAGGYGLKYRTFTRSGSSISITQGSSLGSTNAVVGVQGILSYNNDKVPTGRVVLCGTENNNSTWNNSLSGSRNFASVISINSSGVPTIQTVKTASVTMQGAANGSNDGSQKTDIGMAANGTFASGIRNQDCTLFQKASSSSDTLTEVVAYAHGSISYGAVNLQDRVAYHTPSNNTLVTYDLVTGDTVSSISMSNSESQAFYISTNQNTSTSAVHSGSNIYELPIASNTTENYMTATSGNTNKIVGIANNTVSSGGQVELALPGTTVSGFSGLEIGDQIGVGSTVGSAVVGGSPVLGVAISATEVLIDTVIP